MPREIQPASAYPVRDCLLPKAYCPLMHDHAAANAVTPVTKAWWASLSTSIAPSMMMSPSKASPREPRGLSIIGRFSLTRTSGSERQMAVPGRRSGAGMIETPERNGASNRSIGVPKTFVPAFSLMAAWPQTAKPERKSVETIRSVGLPPPLKLAWRVSRTRSLGLYAAALVGVEVLFVWSRVWMPFISGLLVADERGTPLP